MSETKILLVEDDPDITEVVRLQVKDLGFEIDHAGTGEKALEMSVGRKYALAVLDLNLPGIGGLEVCQRLRQQDEVLPILIITCRGEETDKVLGLELGADDYLTKPFSVRELRARIKALVRRSRVAGKVDESLASKEPLKFGELEIDLERRKVTRSGDLIDLTPTEFDLLVYLAARAGKPCTKQQLLVEVWGYEGEVYENSISPHISRLRNKIEPDPNNPTYVKTVWGIGYAFTESS